MEKNSGHFAAIFAIIFLTCSFFAQADLVSHWRMNESTGALTASDSVKSNDGSVSGVPVWQAGLYGNAISMDGVDDFITLQENTLPASGPISVALWVKATTHDQNACWFHYNVGTLQFTIGTTFHGTGRFVVKDSNGNNYCNYRVSNDTWVQVIVVFDASGDLERVYRGSSNVSRNRLGENGYYSSGWPVTGTSTTIGCQGSSGVYLNGMLDAVRIYDHALNQQEIEDIYNSKGRIYVDSNGIGGTGYSWSQALTSLQDALDLVMDGEQIWVAAGTYTPSRQVGGSGTRYQAYQLINNVSIYGGFSGDEVDFSQRNCQANPTILSGDLNGNGLDENDSYHVLNLTAELELNETAVLDGFIITGGNASGLYSDNLGGGCYLDNADPQINSCIFTNNSSTNLAGAVYCKNSDPNLMKCYFKSNSAIIGGAIYCIQSSPLIEDCIFELNTAINYGGAIELHSQSYPLIDRCKFINNMAGSYGGAIEAWGDAGAKITNSFFNNNYVDSSWGYGGAINFYFNCSGQLINCTIVNNEAANGAGMYVYGSNCDVRNCIFWDNVGDSIVIDPNNAAQVTYSDIQGGWPGTGNIDINPDFADPAGVDGIAGTFDDNYRLNAYSDCINAGDPNYSYAGQTDYDGDPRVAHGRVDIGADEIDHSGRWVHNTTQDIWYRDIQPAITDANENTRGDQNQFGDEIIVYPETYHENINFMGKDITLRSYEPADCNIMAATIIDGSRQGSVVTFYGSESKYCQLQGFTIQNGNNTSDKGGGIKGTSSPNHVTSASISYCRIAHNKSFRGSGGIGYFSGAVHHCIIENNTVEDLQWYNAGGIHLYSDEDRYTPPASITNSIVRNNYGGGILSRNDCEIINCIITGNMAGSEGAGIYLKNDYPNDNPNSNQQWMPAKIINCTIAKNKGYNCGVGVYFERLAGVYFGWNYIINNILHGNVTPSSSQSSQNIAAGNNVGYTAGYTNNYVGGSPGGYTYYQCHPGLEAEPNFINSYDSVLNTVAPMDQDPNYIYINEVLDSGTYYVEYNNDGVLRRAIYGGTVQGTHRIHLTDGPLEHPYEVRQIIQLWITAPINSDEDFHISSISPTINKGIDYYWWNDIVKFENFYDIHSTDIDDQPRIMQNIVDLGADEYDPNAL